MEENSLPINTFFSFFLFFFYFGTLQKYSGVKTVIFIFQISVKVINKNITQDPLPKYIFKSLLTISGH